MSSNQQQAPQQQPIVNGNKKCATGSAPLTVSSSTAPTVVSSSGVGAPPSPASQQAVVVASAPVVPGANSNQPPTTNPPKFGTLVPNRVFVGGIAANTTESELLELFSRFGTVKAAKIIQDRAGVSKGYGFVTFETEEEAIRLQKEDNVFYRERRLNIAPAIKKQPFNRVFESNSPPAAMSAAPAAPYFLPPNSIPSFYQSGIAYYAPPPSAPPGDPSVQQQQVYPTQAAAAVYQQPTGPPQPATYPSMLYPPQQIYVPQQYAYQAMPYEYSYYPNGNSQYLVGGNQITTQHQQPPLQPPGSPPRTQCYNPISYTDSSIYMPVYGTIDVNPMYADAIDLNGGPVPEDGQNQVAYIQEPPHMLPAAFNPALPPPSFPPPPQSSNLLIAAPGPPHQQVPLQNFQISRPSSTETQVNLLTCSSQDVGTTNVTPVVSLRALEKQSEKDLNSMQSGRRRRQSQSDALPVSSGSLAPLLLPSNQQFLQNSSKQQLALPPPPTSNATAKTVMTEYSAPNSSWVNSYSNTEYRFKSHDGAGGKNSGMMTGGAPPTGVMRKNFGGYKHHHMNDNGNGAEWGHRGYHQNHWHNGFKDGYSGHQQPHHHHHQQQQRGAGRMRYGTENTYNTRNFVNNNANMVIPRPVGNNGGLNGSYWNHQGNGNYNSNNGAAPRKSRPTTFFNSYTNNKYNKQATTANVESINNTNADNGNGKPKNNCNENGDNSSATGGGNRGNSTSPNAKDRAASSSPTDNNNLLPSQISQAAPPSSSSNGAQNFIPPTRRNRRSVRRNTTQSAALTEIGAGDAPLPASVDVVGDTSKKMENLKL